MVSCEKCWRDAGGNPDEYQRLIKSRTCTPEEQAGLDATECPKCKRMAVHESVGFCMACGVFPSSKEQRKERTMSLDPEQVAREAMAEWVRTDAPTEQLEVMVARAGMRAFGEAVLKLSSPGCDRERYISPPHSAHTGRPPSMRRRIVAKNKIRALLADLDGEQPPPLPEDDS